MLWLYRFSIGFTEITVFGDTAEKMLNQCAESGILLWHIKRKGSKIRCFISVRDFFLLRRITSKSGVRIHILRKYGLPFIVRRYKNRFGIPVGAALFFSLLAFLSGFVWSVEVSGNKSAEDTEIIGLCGKIGIYVGLPKSKIHPKNAKQMLLLETDRLSWASFNIEGCRLTVEVTETGEMPNDRTPSNLKATADGIITRLDITSGNCLVKLGDTVTKGELLVSGITEHTGSTEFMSSSGSVYALTEKEITVSAFYKKKSVFKTGKKRKKRVFSFFGFDIPLYLGHENGSFEESLEIKKLSLLGAELPIKIYTKVFEYTEEKTVILSENELKKELESEFEKTIKLENIGDYTVKNREFDEIKGGMSLKTLILTEKDIAKRENILFNTGN